jgi:peptidoglycan hydrolase CwlO-like protein
MSNDYEEAYENATPEERIYMRAKQNYVRLHAHHEALREKIHKTQKLVNSLTAELNNQSSKLQRLQEDMAITIERFKAAKAIYGPLKQARKEARNQAQS